MKFLVSKDIHSNRNFVLLLGFYSFMLSLYFIGDIFYLAHFFGLNPEAVLITLKGNEEEFIEPLPLLSMLEHIHISLFLNILALFTSMAIVLRLSISDKHKGVLILFTMASLLFASLSFFATYFLNNNFVYFFYTSTLLWHGLGIYASILVIIELWFKK